MPPKGRQTRSDARLPDFFSLEKPEVVMSTAALSKWIGLDAQGTKNYDEFIKSNVWGTWFAELHKNYIEPEQEKYGRNRPRGVPLGTIEHHIDYYEGDGDARFSSDNRDKDAYDLLDWHAYFLFMVVKNNTLNRNGLFYGRTQMTDHQKYCAVWSILTCEKSKYTPAAKRKREIARKSALKKAEKKASAESARKRRSLGQNTGGSEVNNQSSTSILNPSSSDLDPSGEQEELEGSTVSTPINIESSEESDEDNDDNHMVVKSENQDAPGVKVELPDVVLNAIQNHGENEADRQRYEQGATGAAAIGYTTAQQMLNERGDRPFDINIRWYKHNLVHRCVEGFRQPKAVEKQTEVLSGNITGVEAHTWMRQLAAEEKGDNTIKFLQMNDDDKVAFIENEKLLDNPRFQPQNVDYAALQIGLQPGVLRYPDTPLSMSFKPHQVVGINWVRDMKKRGLRGCLIADQMGLGKTLEALGFIQSELYDRQEKIRRGEDPGPAKVTFVICPAALCSQWKKEIARLGVFEVMIYHGELRGAKGHFKSHLDKKDPIFNTKDEKNAYRIVITTPGTMAHRHGPAALKSYRKDKEDGTKDAAKKREEANAKYLVQDTTWQHDLSGCIGNLIIDEAHVIKNAVTAQFTAVDWLKADFHILLTGTPDVNSIADIEAYVKLVEPSKDRVREVMVRNQLRNLDFIWAPDSCRPENDVQEIYQICRPTSEAVKFIFHQDDDSKNFTGENGILLAALLATFMIRRSQISMLDGQQVGEDIPPTVHRRCVVFNDKSSGEDKLHELLTQIHNENLVTYDTVSEVPMWNAEHHRMLILLCTWLGFADIQNKFTSKDTASWIKKGEDALEDILKLYCRRTGKALPDTIESRLSMVFAGSPKLRAMMKDIVDIVVRDQQKVIVFATLPGQQVLLYAICKALGISTACWHRELTDMERAQLQRDFNDKNEPMILIGSYNLTSVGLNLQERCHIVMFIDPPQSIPRGLQAIARVSRLGQKAAFCKAITYELDKSFNSRQIQNCLNKAVPGAVANLNHAIFGPEMGEDEDGDAILQIGDWVEFNGTLVPTDDPRLPVNHGLPIYSGVSMLRKLLQFKLGVPILVEEEEKDFGLEFDGVIEISDSEPEDDSREPGDNPREPGGNPREPGDNPSELEDDSSEAEEIPRGFGSDSEW